MFSDYGRPTNVGVLGDCGRPTNVFSSFVPGPFDLMSKHYLYSFNLHHLIHSLGGAIINFLQTPHMDPSRELNTAKPYPVVQNSAQLGLSEIGLLHL